jgi:glutaredoxin
VYCNAAKVFFKEKGVTYTEYNVGADLEKRKEMIEKSGQMGVPVIDIDGELVVGFNQPKLKQLLKIQ